MPAAEPVFPDGVLGIRHAVLRFGHFALDLERTELLRDGAPLALRPKAYALLSYLAAHPGRVLGKAELLGAVWPGVVVNDESLSQCVRELRAALGDTGQALIRTVPRRGYLFDAAVVAGGRAPALSPPGRQPAAWLWMGLALAALLTAGLAWRWVDASGATSEAASVDARRSIAILPFTDDEGGRLGEAVAEDVTLDLMRRPGMLVVAFASSAAIAPTGAEPSHVGRELGVRHLVSGRVRRRGGVVEIEARLLATGDGTVHWSGRWRYERQAAWNWRQDIGAGVAGSLGVPVAAEEAAAADHRATPEAYEAMLMGRHQARRVVHLADLRRARAHFERAVALDPGFASAWTHLAATCLDEIEHRWADDRQALLSCAAQALGRALAIDPDHVPALGWRGNLLREQGDLQGALDAYQRVLVANPSAAWAHARAAAMKLQLGRPEEVLVHADMALRLSPLEPTLVGYSHLWAGVAEFYLGREAAAYERMRQSVAAGPNPTRFGALLWLTSLDALLGRQPQAEQHAAEVMQAEPGWTLTKWRKITALTHPALHAGRERFAQGLRQSGLPE